MSYFEMHILLLKCKLTLLLLFEKRQLNVSAVHYSFSDFFSEAVSFDCGSAWDLRITMLQMMSKK